jgi:hypothetical protein
VLNRTDGKFELLSASFTGDAKYAHDSRAVTSHVTTRSKAIVTLVIGDRYRSQWEELCRSNWTEYANKHGYDLFCLDKPLDSSARATARSPAWQKCLILGADFAQSYEQVVWVDSDILINNSCAPCIASSVPVEKVGGVNLWSAPGPAEFQRAWFRLLQVWQPHTVVQEMQARAPDYYTKWGLPNGFGEVITTSVLVLSPRHHKDMLEYVYYEYEDRGDPAWHYEMPPLSYEIIKSGAVTMLDCRFSTSWSVQMALHYPFLLTRESSAYSGSEYSAEWQQLLRCCINIAFHNGYFLHFGPRKPEMELVDARLSFPLNAMFEECDATFGALHIRQSDMARALAKRQHELETMKSSLSWSITAPLRKLAAFMASLRSRL